jgi:hypothetical protein
MSTEANKVERMQQKFAAIVLIVAFPIPITFMLVF